MRRFFTLAHSFEAIFLSGLGLGLVTTILSFLTLSDPLLWAIAFAWALWTLALVSWLAAVLFGNLLGSVVTRSDALRPAPAREQRRPDQH